MNTRLALSLLELIAVLCILAGLSAIAIPLYSDQSHKASETVTRSTLIEVQRAMQQYWHDTKWIPLDGVNSVAEEPQRFDLVWLFRNPVTNDATLDFDPNTRIGWNGPYLIGSTADEGTPTILDGWGNPLHVQYVNHFGSPIDVRIVSSGIDASVDIPNTTATSLLTPANTGDDLYVALQLR